jgi:hypothetical protein
MPLSQSKDLSKSKKILVLGGGRFQITQHGLEGSSQNRNFAKWFRTCPPLTLEFFCQVLPEWKISLYDLALFLCLIEDPVCPSAKE